MRITMQSIHKNILSNLNKINEDMNRINTQISSGKQISRISQDPVNLITALGLRTNLTQITQYQANLRFGDKVIAAAENSLTQMKDLTARAKVLALQLSTGTMTPENRANAAEEVRHLFEGAVSLANTSVNGKYIFGGFRTTGYTEVEPMPFIQDARDGYFINGKAMSRMEERLTGTVGTTDLAAGDVLINGTDIGGVDLDAGALNGLNMDGAAKLKTAINAQQGTTGVTASLTTLTYSAAATTDATGDGSIAFYLNGEFVGQEIANGDTAAVINAGLVSAINAKSQVTGVEAVIGDGTNGAAADTLILKNVTAGDESPIVIGSFTNTAAGTSLSLADGSQAADATHNTGQISLSSSASFEITTSTPDDTILNIIGLGGGSKGFVDTANDGTLIYGSRIGSGDLKINGIEVVSTADSVSTVYADISAAAKAAAINSTTDDHGVSAQISPASLKAFGAVEAGTEADRLTGTVRNALAIGAGDLAINGIATVSAIAIGVPTNGLNMDRAAAAKAAINAISAQSGVSASLTTLSAGAAVNHAAGTPAISFTLNGVAVAFNANGTSNAAVAMQAVEAINAVSGETGVRALRGDGNNGGPVDSIVLVNSLPGDEGAIVLAGLDASETLRIGLFDGSWAADATHNTGAISFFSESAFTLSSPNNPNDDSILQEFSLGGGESSTGISGDLADDGTLEYGATPVYLKSGDLLINGVDIFAKTTAIVSEDSDNALIDAINAKQESTGVVAGRDSSGRLILTAVDGRNVHIKTSALGEKTTHLNGGTPQPNSKVYFGEVRLFSGREFFLESSTATVGALTEEAGFAALGLDGGESVTGVEGDTASDGRLFVNTIHYEDGYVRYAGDRDNDFAVKVGPKSEMRITENGMASVMDTGIFSVLKGLRDVLQGNNFTTVNGAAKATSTKVLLNSGNTGLPLIDELTNGSFSIAVTDHYTSPPTGMGSVSIGIDLEKDSLDDIAKRINGVPGISASWSEDGHLRIESDDPERYTFALTDDTSNFLRVVGADTDNQQVSSLGSIIADLDLVMQNLTDQISDFGARANRIVVQQQIYSNLELATSENLSEREDTDLMQAVMDLRGKEIAYQAALSAAAKTMQLSLVDFLK